MLGLLYAGGISPDVGMGATGMITTAVAAGGLGPAPNYPVHNAICRLVLHSGLFDNAALAVGAVSFIMALGAIVLLTRFLTKLTEFIYQTTLSPSWWALTALGVSYLYFASPLLARVSYFGDRYTTSLFFVLLAANVFLSAMTAARVTRTQFAGLTFFSVFQFFCHGKSLPLIWFFLLVAAYKMIMLEKQKPPIGAILASIALGLTPIIYLVVVSRSNPLFDWANPENLQNLWNSFSRKEYAGVMVPRSWEEIRLDWLRQSRIFIDQFSWMSVAAIAFGLFAIARSGWQKVAIFIGVVLAVSDVTTYLIHWPFHAGVAGLWADEYMLNYYAEFVVVGIGLAVFGMLAIILRLSLRVRVQQVAVGAVIVALAVAHLTKYRENSRGDFHFSEELAENFELVVPPGAIIFTNLDSLFPALVHHQIHDQRFIGRAVFHTELMFRSWYYDDLERLYPAIWQKHHVRLEALRKFFLDFENAGFDESKFDLQFYFSQLNGLIRDQIADGAFVLVDPEVSSLRPGLFRQFQWEPEGLAFRLLNGSYRINDIPYKQFKFEKLRRETSRGYFWAERFKDLFTRILKMRRERAAFLKTGEAEEIENLLEKLK